ncbi:NUDIX hydrolase [Streptomyces sp. NWU339]|uniref:NUDIX domain-containing protein n=1 Tax=Streptomyces sp. NWU339 TaxID=2185284 RepID=UPI000D684410|nr:NUDIX hydrolase [Streptomyces sp. NWU339]PWI08960.1 NUDIX hydrolase [Streptomyces sp. NWU339]
MNASPARPTMSAAAVLANDDGEYLIVKPGYKDGWNLPGGGVDEGETPRQACRRELKEELGIDRTPGRLLLSAYVHTADGAHIYWVFDGGTLTAEQQQAIVLQESELTAFRFSTPSEISPNEIPSSRRPLWDAALGALMGSSTVHLEVVG